MRKQKQTSNSNLTDTVSFRGRVAPDPDLMTATEVVAASRHILTTEQFTSPTG